MQNANGSSIRFIVADGNNVAADPVSELFAMPSIGQAFRGYTPHAVTHYGADFIPDIPKTPPTWPLAPGYGSAWRRRTPEETVAKYQSAIDAGEYCMVGEFGCRRDTPHEVALAWMKHCLKLWGSKNLDWALWNLRGTFGFMDSDRVDVAYEDYRGHKLDRKMLELLRRY